MFRVSCLTTLSARATTTSARATPTNLLLSSTKTASSSSRLYSSTPITQYRAQTQKDNVTKFHTNLRVIASTPFPPPPPPLLAAEENLDLFPFQKHVVKSKANTARMNNNAPKALPDMIQGKKLAIRHSPWRMNLICQLIRGLSVDSAQAQLKFSKKGQAPLVSDVLRKTVNLASIQRGWQPEELEVKIAIVGNGTHLRRMKFMGRGRTGRKDRRFCHVTLKVGLIDFAKKIAAKDSRGKPVTKHSQTRLKAAWDVAKEARAVSDKEREELKALEDAVSSQGLEKKKE
jgi:ribosomal protein L22